MWVWLNSHSCLSLWYLSKLKDDLFYTYIYILFIFFLSSSLSILTLTCRSFIDFALSLASLYIISFWSRKRTQIKRGQWIKSINNLKRRVGSGSTNYFIISKLNVRDMCFPLFENSCISYISEVDSEFY